ncbi:MAG TPA: hypothetical protein DC048_12130 [Planctomycetaceae bacterium]|nr:hypothetical protein [Planctomycetaceae bacterium]
MISLIQSLTLSRSAARVRASALVTRRLHLGCGLPGLGHGTKVLPGWTNIDLEGDGRTTFAWDLTRTLPFADQSVDFIYSEHFIEHLTLAQGQALLRECRRVLTPTGVLRLSTPELRTLVEKYLTAAVDEWADMGWKPSTPCDLLNEGLRLWGHQYVYDHYKLTSVLLTCGFAKVARCEWGSSTHKALRDLETRPNHGDCIVEAAV